MRKLIFIMEIYFYKWNNLLIYTYLLIEMFSYILNVIKILFMFSNYKDTIANLYYQ